MLGLKMVNSNNCVLFVNIIQHDYCYPPTLFHGQDMQRGYDLLLGNRLNVQRGSGGTHWNQGAEEEVGVTLCLSS